jgi:UDPglucose 6-dehydrogenase
MNINVIGIGRLGICTALCLCKAGYNIIGVDVDEKMVESINDGTAYYTEPYVQEYLDEYGYKLKATTKFEDGKDSDVSFIVVPTPSKITGDFDNFYIEAALIKLCEVLPKDKYHVFNIVSTVMPGSCRKFIEQIKELRGNDNFGLTYNPEFIAQGSIIKDFENPDMILIGESNEKAGDYITDIYISIALKSEDINKFHNKIKRMSLDNAEVTKIGLNTYTTMKINYANLLAEICEKIPNGDVDVITDAIGCDSRIGYKVLKGATAFGGPCFPRDNKAFDLFCKDINVDAKCARATEEMNEWQSRRIAEKAATIVGNGSGKKIAILGVSYKPGTPITEESCSLKVKKYLEQMRFEVNMYDEYYKEDGELNDVLRNADLVILMLPNIKTGCPICDTKLMKNKKVLDCWRVWSHLDLKSFNIEYHAIGKNG